MRSFTAFRMSVFRRMSVRGGVPSAPPKEELSPKVTEVGIIQNRCPPPYPPPREGVKTGPPMEGHCVILRERSE